MITIDITDLKILTELVENAKTSNVEIGKKLRIHPNVVAYRINKLESGGIIKEYTTVLDLDKLGLTEQMYVGASLPKNSERDDILRQVAEIPQTVSVISSLGSPESIVFLIGKNKDEVDKVMSKLRNLNLKIKYTSPIIKTYDNGNMRNYLSLLTQERNEEILNKTPKEASKIV
jgi:Lrp/AsnC family leucine-responsive transcriptional regulator